MTQAEAFTGPSDRRYIAYARCAARQGSAEQLDEQIHRIKCHADRLGLRCVDEMRIAGVSGMDPLLREDLVALLARKEERNDFDILMMDEPSRLTRTGLDGIREIESRFEEAGVQIVYADLPAIPPSFGDRRPQGTFKT
jgi:hypothetical protein